MKIKKIVKNACLLIVTSYAFLSYAGVDSLLGITNPTIDGGLSVGGSGIATFEFLEGGGKVAVEVGDVDIKLTLINIEVLTNTMSGPLLGFFDFKVGDTLDFFPKKNVLLGAKLLVSLPFTVITSGEQYGISYSVVNNKGIKGAQPKSFQNLVAGVADYEIAARLAAASTSTGKSINSIIVASDETPRNRDIYVEVTRPAEATGDGSTLTVLVTQPTGFAHQAFDSGTTQVYIGDTTYTVQNSNWVESSHADGMLFTYNANGGKPATDTISAFVISTAITPQSTDGRVTPKLESIVQSSLSADVTPTHNLFFQVLKIPAPQ